MIITRMAQVGHPESHALAEFGKHFCLNAVGFHPLRPPLHNLGTHIGYPFLQFAGTDFNKIVFDNFAAEPLAESLRGHISERRVESCS